MNKIDNFLAYELAAKENEILENLVSDIPIFDDFAKFEKENPHLSIHRVPFNFGLVTHINIQFGDAYFSYIKPSKNKLILNLK
jgi:hypothetical protein